MNFPDWTPKWVAEEFRQDFSDIGVQENDWTGGDEQSRDWLVQVINSPDARIVWESLDKFPEREARLAELAAFIWSAHWGFGHVATKKSEREKIAKDARKHVAALVVSLDRMTKQDWFAMNSTVGSFVDVSVPKRVRNAVEDFHRIYNDDPDSPGYVPIDTLQRAMPAIQQVAKFFVGDAIWVDLQYHLLEGLCGSLDKWADSDAIVTKPDHPNAKRLYFLRSLTSSFVEAYGRPMRKETLALASVFFDCEGLDEAAISRLAPVRTRANTGGLVQAE